MEPFRPEAPEASNAEAEERRRKRAKQRLLERLRRWRKEREPQAPPAETAQQTPAQPEREAQPDPDERKGKLFGRLLKFAIRRPAGPEHATRQPETAEVSPRNRWIRRITHRALDRVVETHDEVRAVVKEEKHPPKDLQEDEASLQSVEWELRRVSDQFEDALAKEGARAESFQGPSILEDATGSPKRPEVPQFAQPLAESPAPDEYPGTDLAESPQLRPLPEAPVRQVSAAEAVRPPKQANERPKLGSTVIRATATGIAASMGLGMNRRPTPAAPRAEAQPIAEQAAAMRAQAEQLQRTQQTLDRMQQQRVDMHNTEARHQRVQETVDMARTQTEVVTRATQTLRAERPAPAPQTSPEQQFVIPQPPSAERVPRPETPPQPKTEAAPQAAYEQAPSHLQQAETVERFNVAPPAQAERSPAAPASKEAPTERELTDRVERDPGRNWKADAQQNQGQTHDYQYADASSTQGLHVPSSYDVHAARQSSHYRNSWQKPSTSWLIVAVLVIIIAGLVMLSMSL